MPDLEAAVRHGRETITVDFKQRLNWKGSRASQLEIVRDIVGFANRDGGLVIIGCRDRGDGSFEVLGLEDDDPIPDGTEIGNLLREYFDPTVPVASGPREVMGATLGVIEVPPFSFSPLIATRTSQDAAGKTVIADGDLVVRTDALSTEKVKARDLRSMLDRAVSARAAQLGALLPPARPDAEPEVASPPWVESVASARLLDLEPIPAPERRPLREVARLVQDARVTTQWGMTAMPSDIDLTSSSTRIIRESGRLIAQARGFGRSREDEDEEEVTTTEITEGLAVRVREVPWETRNPDAPAPIDLTGLFVFVLAGLRFAVNLYGSAEVPRFRYRTGIARPAGHSLTVSRQYFFGLNQLYRATSRSSIYAGRTFAVGELASEEDRVTAGRLLLDEMLYYFGFELTDTTFDAQIAHIRQRGGMDL
jgi:hypothetical protein